MNFKTVQYCEISGNKFRHHDLPIIHFLFCGNLLRDWILRDGNSIRSDPQIICWESNSNTFKEKVWHSLSLGRDGFGYQSVDTSARLVALGPAPRSRWKSLGHDLSRLPLESWAMPFTPSQRGKKATSGWVVRCCGSWTILEEIWLKY